MTHLFTQPLSGISGQRMVDSLDGQSDMERPVTLATVGCLSLQLRVLYDHETTPEPDTDPYDWPSQWQAVGIEVAVCLYGDILARESVWGVWLYLGSREDTSRWTFPTVLKEEVDNLTNEACARVGTVIGQRLDRLHSAQDLVSQYTRTGTIRTGSHVSVSV
jgi:hypothetical protein